MTKRLPAGEVLAEGLLGNLIGAGVYRGWVRALGLRGDERVLDVGTGAGACTRHVAAALTDGGSLTGIEIDERWLAIARRRLAGRENIELLSADACEWARAEAYDVAVLHFVLHDIPAERRLQALRNVAASLRHGGTLFVREPVTHGMTAEEMRGLLGEAGLTMVRESSGSVPLMGPTVDAAWTRA